MEEVPTAISPPQDRFVRPKHKNGHWWIRCGYVETTPGCYARKDHYFGRVDEVDESLAIAAAVKVQLDWEGIEQDYREHNLRQTALGLPKVKPVWPKQSKPTPKKVTVIGVARSENLSIIEAKDRYLANRKKDVFLEQGEAIESTSFNGLEQNLLLSLGLSSSRKGPKSLDRHPIDLSKRLADLTHDDVEEFARFWKSGVVKRRTAINYCSAFKAFLSWCQTKRLGLPAGFTDEVKPLFQFKRSSKKNKIVAFDAEKVKALLSAARESSDKTLLYCLLALNCGYYQKDIGELRYSDLVFHKGEWCLWRARSKSKHQHDEDEMTTLHALWPETHRLLKRHMAPKHNENSRLLLNERGEPLWSEELGKYRRDAISRAHARVTEAVKNSVLVASLAQGLAKGEAERAAQAAVWSLRQWRKLGWNACKRLARGMTVTSRLLVLGDAIDMARLYSGQAIEGVAKNYNMDDFDDLTVVLKKWGDELRRAGVFPEC